MQWQQNVFSTCTLWNSPELVKQTFGAITRPLPFLAPLYTVSMMSIISCLSSKYQLILLLSPVPRSNIICLFLKKNMIVQGSYSSYILFLVSGQYKVGHLSYIDQVNYTKVIDFLSNGIKNFILCELALLVSCMCCLCYYLSIPQSWPNLISTSRSSSFKIAWSTCHPDGRWGKK